MSSGHSLENDQEMKDLPFREVVGFIKKLLPRFLWEDLPLPLKKIAYFIEAFIACVYFGFPARKLKVIGITGTDGKTTTAYFIYSILNAAGKKVALVSTVSAKIGDQEVETGFHVTTPDSWQLQKLIRRIVTDGNEYLVLEVTSHGLDQNRVWGIPFEIGVLTNITHEHLDYHKTFENYLVAKAKLFRLAKMSILNKDDPSFDRLEVLSKKYFSYSRAGEADLTEKELKINVVSLNLQGDYNWWNALAAASVGKVLNLDWGAVKTGLADVKYIPGRMEEITTNRDFRVIVDFAHTPNGLEKSLTTARQLAEKGRVISVFGCAGLRDASKRPIMGEIAGRLADTVILTAEDPRTESVDDIIEQIAKDIVKKENLDVSRITDRKAAIKTALQVAKTGDVIIITGKGHEKSMCFGEKEYPWSDQEVVRELLRKI